MRSRCDRLIVVIVTFNNARTVKPCLMALDTAFEHLDDNVRGQVVIIDNASNDTTLLELPILRTRTTVIGLRENIGFGRAVNHAVSHIGIERGDRLLLLNPDAVPTPQCLEYLMAYMDGEELCGVVVPSMRLPNGKLGRSGGPWPTMTKEVLAFTSLDGLPGVRRIGGFLAKLLGNRWVLAWAANPEDDSTRLCWGSGFCMLIRGDAWLSVGGFDEDYFLYFEDVDLCKRVSKLGLSVDRCSKSECLHFEGLSMNGKKRIYYMQGLAIYMGKYGSYRDRYCAAVLGRLIRDR